MAKEGSKSKITIFDTPVISPLMRLFARTILRITGWKQLDNRKKEKNFIAVFVPHTSAWDFVYMLLFALSLNIKSYWLGKHTLFKAPFGVFFRYVGGLPIDRSRHTKTVDQIVQYFRDIDDMVFTLAPEGTRRPVERWKSGFYHMAVGAGVPIALVKLDYQKKEGGIMDIFYPTGELEKDIDEIRGKFKDVKGKNPKKYIP